MTCLTLMSKSRTVQIKEIYFLLVRLFSEERIGCHEGTKGRDNLLYVYKHILKESKLKQKFVAIVWIGYKTAFDMVPPIWIRDCLKRYIFDKVIKFITEAMKNWNGKLTTGGKTFAEWKIQKGIFQGDVLSPLLFVKNDNDATQLHTKGVN